MTANCYHQAEPMH